MRIFYDLRIIILLPRGVIMKRVLLPVLFLILFLVAGASTAQAVGFGFYGSLGKGSSDWDSSNSAPSNYDFFSSDVQHRTFGISLDTRLSGEDLFNYHMSLGYDTFQMKDFLLVPYPATGSPVQTNLTMRGFVMSHAFGFGGELTQHTRFWMGPEIRFAWASGKPVPGVDVDMFGVGIGPAIGFNMNFSKRFSAVIKAGYQIIRYDADVKGSASTTITGTRNYDVDEKLLYVNLEFFIRSLGDR